MIPSDTYSIESDDFDLSNITLNEAQAMLTSAKVVADDPRLVPVPSLLKDMLEEAKALLTMSYTQFNRIRLTDEYSVCSRRGLCVKTGQLRVELIALKVV